MNRLANWIKVLCATVVLSSLVLTARAWADDDWDEGDDPPARVARMNYAQGSVSFQPGGEGDWVEAVPNRPLTTGDNLWTDRNSRAELHIGSTALRLDGETSLTFLALDDRTIQLRLADGALMLRVRHLDDDEIIEVDTPNLAFQIQRNGEYRVDVDADGHSSIVEVIQGRGEAIGGGQNYTIVANQQAIFSGDDELNYDINQLPAPDDFDNWVMARDRREDRADSANYVSREMTGYEDLDDYGRWTYTANYGPVWVPTRVADDWAPYRYGHWVWVAPWGWTWVDDEPWGFAPFHYGRWCQVGGGWAWVPGPVVARPVYAPALVAFVGGGGFHLSVSLGGGPGVAWFPLAPGEVFVPAYHVSRVYVNQVNVTNTVVNVTKVTNVYNYYTVNRNTNVTRITYANQGARNAVTAVTRDTFVNARPVQRNVVQVQQREIERAEVTHEIGVAPVRPSVIGAGRPTRFAPPAAIANRRVVAERPPAAPTVPFSQRKDPLVARPMRPAQPMGNRAEPGDRPNGGNRPDLWNRSDRNANDRNENNRNVNDRNENDRNRGDRTRNDRPNQPEPAGNRPAPVDRPGQVMGGNKPDRDNTNDRPAPPAQTGNRPDRGNEDRGTQTGAKPEWTPRPQGNQPTTAPTRPEPQQQPQRPEVERPQEQRPQPRNDDRWQPEHPLTRPAPPVQPKNDRQAQDEENKQRQWQQQRERTAPPPRAEQPPKTSREDAPKPKREEPPKPKRDDKNSKPN
jgi:uncharacterized protein DUF6600